MDHPKNRRNDLVRMQSSRNELPLQYIPFFRLILGIFDYFLSDFNRFIHAQRICDRRGDIPLLHFSRALIATVTVTYADDR